MNFCIQKGYAGREMIAIVLHAGALGLEYRITEEAIRGMIPIGTVEYCLPVAPAHRVNFFPEFLTRNLRRSVTTTTGGFTMLNDWFVKDLNGWKTEFETKLYTFGYDLPRGDWLLSKPIKMVNEWRYYIANGEIITTGWYRGEDEEKPAPALDIEFPKDFGGAVDFAETPGGMELIETHAPFACGWYGEEHIDYVYWQYFAWQNLGWWVRNK